jgi:hypothetical protein
MSWLVVIMFSLYRYKATYDIPGFGECYTYFSNSFAALQWKIQMGKLPKSLKPLGIKVTKLA